MNTPQHTFEVLILDKSGKSEITTEKSLVMAISYSEKIWKEVELKTDKSSVYIEDKLTGIKLQVTKAQVADKSDGIAFLINATGTDFQQMEAFREKLFVHAIHRLGFTTARILTDTITESVSLAIYPFLKKTENALRNYLEKSLTRSVGLSWWESTVSEKTAAKVKGKKSQVKFLPGLLDDNMALTDFDDLTEIALKTSLATQTFKTKWEALAELRSSLSGYNVLGSQEYAVAEKLSNEIFELLGSTPNSQSLVTSQAIPVTAAAPASVTPVVDATVKSATTVPLVQPDVVTETPKAMEVPVKIPETQAAPLTQASVAETREVVRPAEPKVITGNEGNFDMITETVMLQELKTAQSLEKGRYVDLKEFVTKTLGPKGYAFGPAYMVAKNMNEKGMLQIYDIKDEKGVFVKAIKVN